MTLTNRIFRPFETLIEPLNLPITALPDTSPTAVVWHFAKMFRSVLAMITVLSVASALISLSVVWMLAYVVDGVVASGAQSFVSDNLTLLIGFAFLLLVIDPLITFIDHCYMNQTVRTLLPTAMRWQGHKAVENQDVAFFEDMFAGQVASKIEQVTRSVWQQLLMALEDIPQYIIQFIGSLGLLLVLAWQLAIPVVVWIIANVMLAVFVTPKLMDRSAKVAEASARATGAMTDVYSNISIVKAFSAEDSEGDSIREVLSNTVDTRHQEQRVEILTYSAVNISNSIMAVTIFSVGIWGLLDGFVSMGDFVAAATITRMLFMFSFAFISLGFSISETYGTLRDAMPVMTAKPTLIDKPNAQPFNLKNGEIVLDSVSYSYLKKSSQDNDSGQDNKPVQDNADSTADTAADSTNAKASAKPVIENMDLTIAPGEKVGLVGLSGAGKSTVISLLLRLRDVDNGAIRIDGQDVRDIKQNTLRQEIGVITQDVFLLNRSVRDNVAYGVPSATDDEIMHALELAKAAEFVNDLQDKDGRTSLDAHVGDKGIKLSGGQRQRLAIARVILKDPKILLLDEATSALDSEAETEIQQNLQNIMIDKTALVVAHRLSTIAEMDRLMVMDKGKIVEQGTHNELVKNGGLYARLWQRQSGGFLPTV